MTLKDSSLIVERFEPDASNMISIRHFTGQILLSEDEANQLRTLINEEIAHLEPMPTVEAFGLMDAQAELVAKYTQGSA
jgi:hypothetical protein